MENIKINVGGKDFVFAVDIERDDDAGAPWECCDGHGPVSDWERRDKRPGEMILHESRGMRRFYDYAEACRIALRDGWNAAPYDIPGETARQRAARAALADFEYLRGWCKGEWHYVGVIVTLLGDDDGERTEISDSVWGLEASDKDRLREEARLIADDIARGYGIRWGEIKKTTLGYFGREI